MKKKFAEGLCFKKLFLIFVIGCIFGAYYEEIVHIIKMFIRTGVPSWEPRRGVIYGPFSPIYGAGAVLITYLLMKKKRTVISNFVYASFIGGAFEYVVGFLQEFFIGTTSWDYSAKLLNINGRTTLIFMLFWGILGLFFVYYFYPFISKIIESIDYKAGTIFTNVLLVLLSINLLVSWTALIRQTLRRNGIKPFTIVGKIYDEYYNDDYLHSKFPNMIAK